LSSVYSSSYRRDSVSKIVICRDGEYEAVALS
jgi:hypothetical protein